MCIKIIVNSFTESRIEIQSKQAVWNSSTLYSNNELYFKLIFMKEK